MDVSVILDSSISHLGDDVPQINLEAAAAKRHANREQ